MLHVHFAGTELLIEASFAEFNGLIDKEAKTHASRRIALELGNVETLTGQSATSEEQSRRYGYHLGEDSCVFSSFPDGSRPRAPGRVTLTFAQVKEGAGLTRIRLQDLWHFAATILMARGVSLRTISRRLGHAKPSTTLAVYSHFFVVSDREGAEIIGGEVSTSREPTTTNGSQREAIQRHSRPSKR